LSPTALHSEGGLHSNKPILKQTNKGKYEMKALTTLLVVGMFLTIVAMADAVDDVKAEGLLSVDFSP